MSTPAHEDPSADSPEFLAAKNVAVVTISIAVMAVILGVFAILVSSLSQWLAFFAVLEAAGVFFMASRYPQDAHNDDAEARVRTSRRIAIFAVALALVATARAFI